MYDGLETNIPHSLMKFSDAPSLESHQLFPKRKTVEDYLEEYGQGIKRLVHFQTQVTDVYLCSENGKDLWSVPTKNIVSGKSGAREYDAVVVACGHFNVPSLPDISGIREWDQAYPGIISHSKFYQNPESFANKKVIIVGNSASGIDIGSQIGKVARHPVLVSQRSYSPMAFAATYKENVPQIAEFLPQRFGRKAVRFIDGRIEADIDKVVFCTGYYYSFPFLSSLQPDLIRTGERVQHLYEHLFYIKHPTLVFIGMMTQIIPFRTFEGQAAVLARIWSGRLNLPPQEVMERWEEGVIADRGTGKPFHVLKFPLDFNYHNRMVDWALQAKDPKHGKLPPKWSDKETWARERFPAIKRSFAEQGSNRCNVRTIEELGFDYEEWKKEIAGQRSDPQRLG